MLPITKKKKKFEIPFFLSAELYGKKKFNYYYILNFINKKFMKFVFCPITQVLT